MAQHPRHAIGWTFSLSGFRTVKREGVAISGAGAITINTELSVGGVAETVVVQGETPIVDVQTTRHQAVIENKTINELPIARGYGALLAAVPTLQGAGASSSSSVNPSFFTVHGGPANEGTVQLDGLNVGAAFNGGGVSGNAYDTSNPLKYTFGGIGVASIIDAGFYIGAITVLFGVAWYYALRAFGEEQLAGWTGMPASYYRDALWIGAGTVAHFRNLVVTPESDSAGTK